MDTKGFNGRGDVDAKGFALFFNFVFEWVVFQLFWIGCKGNFDAPVV